MVEEEPQRRKECRPYKIIGNKKRKHPNEEASHLQKHRYEEIVKHRRAMIHRSPRYDDPGPSIWEPGERDVPQGPSVASRKEPERAERRRRKL